MCYHYLPYISTLYALFTFIQQTLSVTFYFEWLMDLVLSEKLVKNLQLKYFVLVSKKNSMTVPVCMLIV